MKILLIAGHGDGDCGATGSGYKEADLTREAVVLLKAELDGYADVTIADTNKNWFQYLKTHSFNFKSYDYVLEIHFNACVNDKKGDGKTTGTEIYVTTGEMVCPDDVEVKIVKGISSIGLKNRGVKHKNFSVIQKIKKQGVSSALLEMCFIDDIDDIKLYQSKKSEIIKAIADGIISGFSLEKKVDELKDACSLLASKGIINSPDYWAKGSGYSDENTVLLIKKFASYVRGT
jgi:N-acetylmuramoyl-L-alanine amidase